MCQLTCSHTHSQADIYAASVQSRITLQNDMSVPQTLLRQAEQAAKCEALTQLDAVREEAAAAAEEKHLADAALDEIQSQLQAATAQVRSVWEDLPDLHVLHTLLRCALNSTH